MTGSGDDRDDDWEPFGDDAEGTASDRGETEDPGGGDAEPTNVDAEPTNVDAEPAIDRNDTGDEPEATPRDPGSSEDPLPDRDASRPSPEPSATDEEAYGNPITYFRKTDDPIVATVREVLSSVLMVAIIGGILFGISGLWPPLVAIESGSMEPHMWKGDLVFVVDNGRFAPDGAHAGVVTWRQGNPETTPGGPDAALAGYWSFGEHGNVVVYEPNGQDRTPIIHRARFFVEEGENWYDEANPNYIGTADNCRELRACPAPHDGFITKGDHNPAYDQVAGRSTVVKAEWVQGVAKVRVPWLGCIRLELSGNSCF